MGGVKSGARLKSYMTAPALYRTIAAADGVITPASPPDVATIDLTGSPQGLNTIQAFITPGASGAPVMEAWAIVDGSWYFLATKTITAGRPEVWTIENVASVEVAIVWTATGAGTVTVMVSKSN